MLWKQDVDLGFCLPQPEQAGKVEPPDNTEDDIEKLKALLDIKKDEVSVFFFFF